MILSFLTNQLSENVDFLGWDISIWQLILIPIILALLELLKYLYKIYIGSKKNNESELSDKQVRDAVDDIMGVAMESESEKMKNALSIKENKYILRLIKKQLIVLRKQVKTDRMWVAKFHNGNDNETYGISNTQLFTIIEESLDYGVSSQKSFFYSIPIPFFNIVLEKTREEGIFIIEDLKSVDKTLGLVLSLQGIKSMGAIAIFDDENNMKGVLGFDFIREKKSLSNKDIEYLKNNTSILLEYLRLYQMYSEEKK